MPLSPPHPGFPALLGLVSGRLAQQGLELRERVGRERRVPAALDGEPDRPVEGRHLIESQPLRLSFPETNAGHAFPVLELVVHRHRVAAKPHHVR